MQTWVTLEDSSIHPINATMLKLTAVKALQSYRLTPHYVTVSHKNYIVDVYMVRYKKDPGSCRFR